MKYFFFNYFFQFILKRNGKKVEVDKTFIRRLFTLIKICIPSIRSWEFLQLIILSILLLSRTFLTITIATLMGNNVSFLVEGEFYKFVNGVTKIGLIAIPASAVNSALKYVSSVFAIFCRRRLTFHAHSHYLSPVSFYPTSTSFSSSPSLSSSSPPISNWYLLSFSSFPSLLPPFLPSFPFLFSFLPSFLPPLSSLFSIPPLSLPFIVFYFSFPFFCPPSLFCPFPSLFNRRLYNRQLLHIIFPFIVFLLSRIILLMDEEMSGMEN